MKKVNRRKFIRESALGAVGSTALISCAPEKTVENEAPYINFNKTYLWKMVTTWPPNFPVVGEGCNMFADLVDRMSGGRMKIQVYGGGELIPSLECFDAVSNGAVELGHGASYYWAGKVPAGQFFASVPFGMNAQQTMAWIITGGGDKLWEETYYPFNIIPMICGSTGAQMGGWFNKEINSIEDINGLKMRIPGLGGKVLNKAGGSAVTVAGGEIFTNLERGVIDATEWIGPYHDYKMGFHKVTKFYYYPGWHEPGTVLELLVNKPKYQELPSDLQFFNDAATTEIYTWMWMEFETKNSIYLRKLIDEEGVVPRPFPKEVLNQLRIYTKEAVEDLASLGEKERRISDAYYDFRKSIEGWAGITEKVYYGG
jgi:TRAP-type mannitol/chloroaromatic compound transport system substrate-binding protein